MANLKPNNVIRVPCDKKDLFKYWLEFLAQFHHLTGRELEVAALYLEKRYELSKVILDPILLDRTLFSEDVQREIKDICGMSSPHYQVILSKLKSKQFFLNKQINPRLIPNIRENEGMFQLLLILDCQNEV